MVRDQTAGPESGPCNPFPIRLSGKVIRGFGRGSKELGVPTANIPISGLDVGGHSDIESGIYFGWAALRHAAITPNSSAPTVKDADRLEKDAGVDARHSNHDVEVHPMVMSIGCNPVYMNERRSVEVHLIHRFEHDFYDALLNLSILGFIRPERDYESLDDLIVDIKTDIDVSRRSLERPSYAQLGDDTFLQDFRWAT